MKKQITIWKLATGIILIGLGVFFVYAAMFLMPGYDKEWIDSSLRTQGTVIELRETYRNRAYCYYPVIQYATQDNRTLTFIPDTCYSKNAYPVGRKVSVRYGKKDAAQAYIDLGENDRSSEIALIIFSLFLFAGGAVFIVISVRKE